MSHNTHEDNIEITINLSAAPQTQLGFGNVLLIAPLSNSSLSASEQPVKAYQTAEDVAADWTTQEEEAARVYFSQEPQPDTLLIGEWDDVNDSIDTALNNIIAADDNFYGVAATTRTDTDQEVLSAEVESNEKPMIHFLQSSLDDIVTTSSDPPLSGTALEPVIGRERTMLLYHPTDAEWYDMAQSGGVLPFDVDQTSAPFFNDLKEVADPRGSLPSAANIGTQQNPANLRNNNANIPLPYGPSDNWTAPGTNANGRQASVILTRDWFKARLESDTANEIVTEAKRGNKIPVGLANTSRTVGQARFAKLVRSRFKQGSRAGHFLEDQINLRYPEVSQNQVDSGITPLEGDFTVAIGTQAVTFTFNFQRSPVAA